jgi:hypothetical protein
MASLLDDPEPGLNENADSKAMPNFRQSATQAHDKGSSHACQPHAKIGQTWRECGTDG